MSDTPSPEPRPLPTRFPSGSQTPVSPPTYSNENVHLLDRLAVIYRYRRVATTVFVLTMIALMIQNYTNIKVYQARAQVLIEDERSTAMPGLTADLY